MDVPVIIYQQSTVAFVDILGFKNALTDKSKARDILVALGQVKQEIEGRYFDPIRQQFQGIFDIELTAFSDSIVISGSENQTVSVLFAALEFSRLLVNCGFLCRGAVACGELYHKDGIVFGKGLVEAYQAESTRSIYPRIILDEKSVGILENSENKEGDFADLIRTDKDGNNFLNLLYLPSMPENDIKPALSNLVEAALAGNCSSPSVKQKHMWLKNEYKI